jgi:hypothetical protein
MAHGATPNYRVRPPNALLLGVCRDPKQESWNDFLVTDILEEALELTKIRLVDLDSLQQVGHILPALYFALNLEEDTISANFTSKRQTGGATNRN